MGILRAVVFDWGGVLAHTHSEQDYQFMADRCELSRSAFSQLFLKSRGHFDRGDIDAITYWSEIASNNLSPEAIKELVRLDAHSLLLPNEPVISWAADLRRARVVTAILSNMPTALVELIKDQCAWVRDFAPQVFSCQVRSIKPEPEIYAHCLQTMRLPGSDVLFLDDKQANIDAARQAGMQALLFSNVQQSMDFSRQAFNSSK